MSFLSTNHPIPIGIIKIVLEKTLQIQDQSQVSWSLIYDGQVVSNEYLAVCFFLPFPTLYALDVDAFLSINN